MGTSNDWSKYQWGLYLVNQVSIIILTRHNNIIKNNMNFSDST